MTDIAIIGCPPCSQYEIPPKDMSECTEETCPYCQKKMWLSIKKKDVAKIAHQFGKHIIIGCYDCILKEVQNLKDDGQLGNDVQLKTINL